MTPPVRILIVDDQELFREGLHTLLSMQPDLQVVGEARNSEEALRLAGELNPDVVLMDLRMAVLNGVAATRHLKGTRPEIKVIVLTTFDDDDGVFEGLRAGAGERAQIIELLRQSSDPFAGAQEAGVSAAVSQFLAMLEQRECYRALFRAFFRDFNVLVAPVTVTSAFKHISDQIPRVKRTIQVNGRTVPYTLLPVYVGLATYSGLPATVFPWGKTQHGLPLGLQVIGRYLEDHTAITFAWLLEREFGGFTLPAVYSS